jgi:hypothetical protein
VYRAAFFVKFRCQIYPQPIGRKQLAACPRQLALWQSEFFNLQFAFPNLHFSICNKTSVAAVCALNQRQNRRRAGLGDGDSEKRWYDETSEQTAEITRQQRG